MVDPNPARGMPLPLQRYWLVGKGAAKIRWRMPHDFNRCVRNLRKYFPKNPEGLCNILHQKAVGAPPGKGHPGGEHSLIASMDPDYYNDSLVAAQELMDKQPQLGKFLWVGPLAPIGRATEEPRQARTFLPGALRHRALPLPYAWRERSSAGHDGAVVVGRILGLTYGPDHRSDEYAWGWGDFLDEEIIPESKKARYLMEQGIIGSSLDPGGRVTATIDPRNGQAMMSEFTIGGATMVPIPAFSDMRMYSLGPEGDWDDDDDLVMDLMEGEGEDCGCDDTVMEGLPVTETVTIAPPVTVEYAANEEGWRGLPLAMREARFDNDDAVKRIAAWAGVNAAGADVEKLKRAFMYFNPKLPPTATTSYRLPFGDVINGRLTLVYHAIYAAAALLSGAHGGIPDIPPEDQERIKNTISNIYAHMATEFNDSSIRAPWDRSGQPGVQMSAEYAVTEPYGDVAYADPGYRDNKKRYPIDTPEHVRAAWSYINQEKNAAEYTPEQLQAIRSKIKAAAKKHGIVISEEASMDDEYSSGDEGYPVAPPKKWFERPEDVGRDWPYLTVTPEGHVYGYVAQWGVCHRDVTNRDCVMAPKSQLEYAPFHLGTVVTAEGEAVRVGKIVMDTRHADIRLGYAAASIHYDNTGDEAAVIRCGEDEFGIWLSGAMVPEANPKTAAKLRRSPISGDWRRERGHLELTAALAVNAPAFPVYSIEDGIQYSLVAAGTVWPDHDDVTEDAFTPPPNGIFTMAQAAVDEAFAILDRRERLADLLEDEEIYAQRERAARLRHMFAMDDGGLQPAPSAAAATGSGQVPAVPAPGEQPQAAPIDPSTSSTDQAGMDPAAWNIAAMADARYSIVPEGAANNASTVGGEEEVPAPAPAAPVAPEAAPIQAPAVPVQEE